MNLKKRETLALFSSLGPGFIHKHYLQIVRQSHKHSQDRTFDMLTLRCLLFVHFFSILFFLINKIGLGLFRPQRILADTDYLKTLPTKHQPQCTFYAPTSPNEMVSRGHRLPRPASLSPVALTLLPVLSLQFERKSSGTSVSMCF